jgi:hypothetical protein
MRMGLGAVRSLDSVVERRLPAPQALGRLADGFAKYGMPVQKYGMRVQTVWDSGAKIWDAGAVASTRKDGNSHLKRT